MESFRFDFKSVEEIAGECKSRNLSVYFAKNIDILYESLAVSGRTLGNRLAILPMEGSDGTEDGKPGDLTFRRWKRFAEGGAKLIWGEAAAVVPEGRSNPRQLMVIEENKEEFAELVKQARRAHTRKFGGAEDLQIGIQLTHAGRHSFEKPHIAVHSPIIDPVSFVNKRTREPLPEDYPIVTDGYLEQLEDRFVEAAVIARDASFDFVDIKQCHGYLLHELLSARTRPGNYGGAFKNRRKFVRNVVTKIRAAVGNDMLIASRLNVFDGVPFVKDPETGMGKPVDYPIPYKWGWGVHRADPLSEDLTEPKRLVQILSGAGVDFFGISAGVPYWSPHYVRPFNRPASGGYSSPEHPLEGVDRLFRLTAAIQGAFPDIPMVGAGYSWLREFMLQAAAANMAMSRASIAGVGRGAFAYPEFAVDGLESGRVDSKKVCLGDSMCSNMLKGRNKEGGKIPAGCPVRDPEYKAAYKLLEPS
jgi:2,4-dienoyl-CoA reductase-like NADH-dependent reductase (Old Yellow Enzyme family)